MKVLQPGNCVVFGSAFKIPMICKLEMPNPTPYRSNADASSCWASKQNMNQINTITPPQGANFNATNANNTDIDSTPRPNLDSITTINIMPNITKEINGQTN